MPRSWMTRWCSKGIGGETDTKSKSALRISDSEHSGGPRSPSWAGDLLSLHLLVTLPWGEGQRHPFPVSFLFDANYTAWTSSPFQGKHWFCSMTDQFHNSSGQAFLIRVKPKSNQAEINCILPWHNISPEITSAKAGLSLYGRWHYR